MSATIVTPSHPSTDPGAWTEANQDPRVLVADGYGITVTVKAGHLVISDGIAGRRRVRRVARLPRSVTRLVVLGSTGGITFDAARWMDDAGIPWVQMTQDGRVTARSGPGREDARILRAQMKAGRGGPYEPIGIEVMRILISAKIREQASVIDDFFSLPEVATYLRDMEREITRAETIERISAIEGTAASSYWQAWTGRVHVPFSPDDYLKVPARWGSFQSRSSLAYEYEGSARNRNATDPVNAMLNYLYSVAESEAVNSLYAHGMNPVLGINHTDRPNRDSMALDLMEPARPFCDRIVLRMLDTGMGIQCGRDGRPEYFDRRWASETKEGVVRVNAPLTHALAGNAGKLGDTLRPLAERVSGMLARSADGIVSAPRQKSTRSRATDPAMVSRIITDDAWAKILPLIQVQGPARKMGRPRALDNRTMIAAMALKYLLSVPWGRMPMNVSRDSMGQRMNEWVTSGAWPRITEIIRESWKDGTPAGL